MNTSNSLTSLNWTTTSITTLQLQYIVNLQLGSTPANAIPNNVVTLSITINVNSFTNPMTLFPLGQYQSLQSLTLSGFLTGPLSPALSSLSSLSTLVLNYNNLNGALDTINWGNMTSLTSVVLSSNNFTSFGSAFGNTPTVQQLYVDQNPNLAGTFPAYLLQSLTFNQM